MKLVVGLGNPGKRYAGTRHNVGFDVIDTLARGSGVTRFQQKFDAEVAEAVIADQRLLLVKPQTFMNLSGRSVRQLIDFYQVPVQDVLVVCDDINLPLGRLRVRRRGSAGGHNGLKSIQNHLGTTEYSRLRIGVGAPEGKDTADYVLDRFGPADRAIVHESILSAVEAVVLWSRQGIEACMNQYNA